MVFHWLWDLVVRISANSVAYFMMRATEWDLFMALSGQKCTEVSVRGTFVPKTEKDIDEWGGGNHVIK